MDLEALVKPVVEADGLELVDVSFARESGRRVLRVTVDRDGGVDLEAIATTSRRLSRRLDLEPVTNEPYRLEVSSPGLERPLRTFRDFSRSIGDKVRIKVASPVPETFESTLVAADDEGITVSVDSVERRLAYPDIESARTIFEWGSSK